MIKASMKLNRHAVRTDPYLARLQARDDSRKIRQARASVEHRIGAGLMDCASRSSDYR
jgi:division protein CdvB (Snf7/Vps24/ESCRT-III family)